LVMVDSCQSVSWCKMRCQAAVSRSGKIKGHLATTLMSILAFAVQRHLEQVP